MRTEGFDHAQMGDANLRERRTLRSVAKGSVKPRCRLPGIEEQLLQNSLRDQTLFHLLHEASAAALALAIIPHGHLADLGQLRTMRDNHQAGHHRILLEEDKVAATSLSGQVLLGEDQPQGLAQDLVPQGQGLAVGLAVVLYFLDLQEK